MRLAELAKLDKPRGVTLAYSWGDETQLFKLVMPGLSSSFQRVLLMHASSTRSFPLLSTSCAPTARCRASPTPSASTLRHCASPLSLRPLTTRDLDQRTPGLGDGPAGSFEHLSINMKPTLTQ